MHKVKSIYYPSTQSCQFTQIPAREVLLMKVINMHVFICHLETRKHFSQGDVSYNISTT